jgi:hypothetical protein
MSRSHLLRRSGAFAAALFALLAACDSAPTETGFLAPVAGSPDADEATLVLLNPAGLALQDVHLVPCGRSQIRDEAPSARIDDSARDWTIHVASGCYDLTVLDRGSVVWQARRIRAEPGRITYVLLGNPGIPTPPYVDGLLAPRY